jgi:manganese/zinc/iron transport system permease protein
MSVLLVLNAAVIAILWKELKLSSFDPALAFALGFSPALLHYSLMALVSVTAVGAFDAVGSILVVALMVGPPVTAYLLTDRLGAMLGIAAAVGAVGALAGYWLAHALDASIAGSIATVIGAEFTLTFLLAPGRGMVALARRRARQRVGFAETMLAIHLLNHEGGPAAADEARLDHLRDLLRWDDEFAQRIVGKARRDGLVVPENGSLRLTAEGRALAAAAIADTAYE